LPFTFGVKLNDYGAHSFDALCFPGDSIKEVYKEDIFVGYRWFDTKNVAVMYPFGYGLTYTTFEYVNLKTDREKFGKNEVITISLELKNTGKVAAEEVPQVYIHRINSKVEWPLKELKSFTRIALNPGENKTVNLEIPVKNLQYWNEKKHEWQDDLGKIELQVGTSAGEIKLKQEVTLK